MIRKLKISSRAISEAYYNTVTKELNVRFHTSGAFYTSWNVPLNIIEEFENASSQGSYYNKQIKEWYV